MSTTDLSDATPTIFRFVVIGSGGVGKSALTIQFVKSKFVDHYDPTIEDSYRKVLEIDEKEYTIDILDTAGQEEYTQSMLQDQYMRNGDGFLGVYSVIDRESFDRLKDLREEVGKVKEGEDIAFVIASNKVDLSPIEWEVTMEQGNEYAKKIGAPLLETSAKTGSNVNEVFKEVVLEILRKRNIEIPSTMTSSKKIHESGSSVGGSPKRRLCILY